MHLFYFEFNSCYFFRYGEKVMELTRELKKIMDSHLEKFPNVSVNALATRSGVGATTLRRILNLSLKGDPSPHTVLSLVSVVYKEKKLSKLLPRVEGPLGEFLRECFGQFMEEDVPHTMDLDLNEALVDRFCYLIYKLAANRPGSSRNKVLELFGKLGEERLDYLIQKGWIIEEKGFIHAKEKNYSLDVRLSKKHLPELIQFYKPDEVGSNQNIFYTLSESLNEEGIKKIKEIQYEAVRKIYEVMSANEFAGELPYFTINLSDTMELAHMKGALQ